MFVSNARTDSYDPGGSRNQNGLLFLDSLRHSAASALRIKYQVYEDEGHAPFPTIYDALKWMYSPEAARPQ